MSVCSERVPQPTENRARFKIPSSENARKALTELRRAEGPRAWFAVPGRSRCVCLLLLMSVASMSGCAGKDNFLTGSSSPGQLKATLSHLQFENEQLKTKVAQLEEEHRTVEDRLVQEQIHNGDLAARLDDARNLLRDRGVEADTRMGARSRGSRAIDSDENRTGVRTLPAGRTTRKPRKPPAASIRGDLDDLPAAPEHESENPGTISYRSSSIPSHRPRFPDDPVEFGPDDDHLRWQPVATGPDPQAQPSAETATTIYRQSRLDLPIPPDAFIRPASAPVWGPVEFWV